ncbi:MAG: CHAT domain-containing protein [Methylosarcina sp.]
MLELEEPEIKTLDDKSTQLSAKAEIIYEPTDKAQGQSRSHKFRFTVPLGPIELDDLRWYLEQYQIWPAGEFKRRAERIAAKLPQWGQALYQAALNDELARQLAQKWRQAPGQRRFSVFIDDEALDQNNKAQTLHAANALWALPWELLHDGTGYLSEGKQGGSVRRRLPNRHTFAPFKVDLPIKVLLVSPRPRDEEYIDHRITAKPMVQALQTLGHLVELTILSQPTLQALQSLLQKQPFHVLHFDGHGVYDRNKGLGALCFEQAATASSERGKLDLVYADKLAAILREHRIPLVFLEACQSAQSEDDPVKSVAAALLNVGIVSVAAMTHSVLVVSAELFVREFYL